MPRPPTTALPPRAPDQLRLKGRWHDYLGRQRLKTTQQREAIVDEFLLTSSHVSIDELLLRVRRHQAKVGYATVYRTLKLLVECGLATARQFGDGQTRYEVADDVASHHDHLICVQCGLILEFENPEIERLQEEMAASLGGFKVVRHKLELYGLCPKAMGEKGGHCPNEAAARGK